MKEISIQNIDSALIISLSGSISSINASDIEKELLDSINNLQYTNVKFDLTNLEYISSAGLRVILKCNKLQPNMELINVKPNVYEIFEMTGFTTMMTIKKAMKEFSIEGCELIGQGYCGKVYRIDPDTIIKVYYRPDASLEDIYRERAISKQAFILGVPTAMSFDVVKVKEGGYGAIYELLKSDSFNKLIINHPENFKLYQRKYYELLKAILSTDVPEGMLPDKRNELWIWYNYLKDNRVFEDQILAKIEHLYNSIPKTLKMVHGDYHIKNIMMQGDDPLLIDMDTLGFGHPIFEFSAFFLTYIGYGIVDENNLPNFIGISNETGSELFYGAVDYIYGDRTKQERDEIIKKITLFGYIWLIYKDLNFDKDNLTRINASKQIVLSLINEVNSFDF